VESDEQVEAKIAVVANVRTTGDPPSSRKGTLPFRDAGIFRLSHAEVNPGSDRTSLTDP